MTQSYDTTDLHNKARELQRQIDDIQRRWLRTARYPLRRAEMRAERFRIEREMEQLNREARA